MGGPEVRTAEEVWRKMAESEARMHLMVELGHIQVGFPDVEQFCLDLETKYRATASGELREKGGKSPEWQVVKVAMKLKLIDEKRVSEELLSQKYKMRKEIEDEFGKNSRKARNRVKNLRKEAGRAKKEAMMTYEGKLKHLRRKYRQDEEEKLSEVPEAMNGLRLEKISNS